MFANVLGLIRGDVSRQIGWAKREAGRQTRFTVLTAALAMAGGVAALGAAIVALIALHAWLATRYGPWIAFATVGGALALTALVLFALAFLRHRPIPSVRPELQSAHPAALIGALKQDTIGEAAATAERLVAGLKGGNYGAAAHAAERLVAGVKSGSYREAVAAGEQAYRVAEDNLRRGSRPAVFATLAMAVAAGLLVGRRL